MNKEENIQPIVDYLLDNGFTIVEQFNYYVRMESNTVTFVFSRDPRESGYAQLVGRKGGELNELYTEIYTDAFEGYQSYSKPYPYNFIEFLKREGKGLVMGDNAVFERLEKCTAERNALYNYQRIKRQALNELEKLWQEKDYKGFVAAMNITDSSMLPEYYSLRYKIAAKKVK